jgi:hypothetical protein
LEGGNNMTNKYTTKSRLLKILRNSRTQKKKAGWSREMGAGFVAEDIISVAPDSGGLFFVFSWGTQTIPVQELNLRETEEAIKFLEKKV